MQWSKDTDSDIVTPFNLPSIRSALITRTACVNQTMSMEDLHKLSEGEKVVYNIMKVT